MSKAGKDDKFYGSLTSDQIVELQQQLQKEQLNVLQKEISLDPPKSDEIKIKELYKKMETKKLKKQEKIVSPITNGPVSFKVLENTIAKLLETKINEKDGEKYAVYSFKLTIGVSLTIQVTERYSHFLKFHEKGKILYEFPPKKVFTSGRHMLESSEIKKRGDLLEKYLTECVSDPIVLSNESFFKMLKLLPEQGLECKHLAGQLMEEAVTRAHKEYETAQLYKGSIQDTPLVFHRNLDFYIPHRWWATQTHGNTPPIYHESGQTWFFIKLLPINEACIVSTITSKEGRPLIFLEVSESFEHGVEANIYKPKFPHTFTPSTKLPDKTKDMISSCKKVVSITLFNWRDFFLKNSNIEIIIENESKKESGTKATCRGTLPTFLQKENTFSIALKKILLSTISLSKRFSKENLRITVTSNTDILLLLALVMILDNLKAQVCAKAARDAPWTSSEPTSLNDWK